MRNIIIIFLYEVLFSFFTSLILCSVLIFFYKFNIKILPPLQDILAFL